jgi:hypothetical protein
MSRTDPGGQPVVTTGYGQRARPPIQPPGGGGPQFPDLDRIANAAFSNLPVDEAIKATEAATRFIGLRGYQKELESGRNAAQAFAKWGPMLFRQATGIPEAIDRSVPTPITPQQLIGNRMRQQEIDNQQKAAQARIDAAKVMTPYQSAEIELRKQAQAAKPAKEMSKSEEESLKDIYAEIKEYREASLKLNPNIKKEKARIDDLQHKMLDAKQRIEAITKPPSAGTSKAPNPAGTKTSGEPSKVTTQEQWNDLPSGTVYLDESGKKWKKP